MPWGGQASIRAEQTVAWSRYNPGFQGSVCPSSSITLSGEIPRPCLIKVLPGSLPLALGITALVPQKPSY